MDSVAKLLLSETNLGSPALSELRFHGSNDSEHCPILIDFIQTTVICKDPIELIQDDSELVFQIPYELESMAIHTHNSHNDRPFYIHKSCKALDYKTDRFKVNPGSTLIEIRLKPEEVEKITIHLVLEENNGIVSTFSFFRKHPSQITNINNIINTTNNNSEKVTLSEESPTEVNVPSAFPVPKTVVEPISPYPVSMEDGPVFRETLSELEQLIPKLNVAVRSVVENLHNYEGNSKQLFHSRSLLITSLNDLSKSFPSSYGCSFNQAMVSSLETVADENKTTINMLMNIVSGASKPTALDASLALNKRTFEEESKKYYEWISKLLSSGKTKDEKLLSKRKAFEASKLDYFNFLYDTTISLSLNFMDPESDFVKSYTNNRSQRFAVIRKIEGAINVSQLNAELLKITSVPSTAATKSGILFTQGGQGKSGWHKQWVVLQNGKLSEFMDWRKGTSRRNDPIDVSLCNIKPMDIDKRKFCFRVITSTGMEHYFQAISETDRDSWIQALYDAGQDIRYRRSTGDSAAAKAHLTRRLNGLPDIGETDAVTAILRILWNGYP
ncbi:unnamed protein product [Ambrosiozyma monospora]|uniref:Unnamed protein product n=1 Tax=Ambrosiozyma monospora TaxID=43982 RepID=A0ACB5T7P0_AMBMO|nr:unnamed protein product [Ambrosiozyma monospora]